MRGPTVEASVSPTAWVHVAPTVLLTAGAQPYVFVDHRGLMSRLADEDATTPAASVGERRLAP